MKGSASSPPIPAAAVARCAASDTPGHDTANARSSPSTGEARNHAHRTASRPPSANAPLALTGQLSIFNRPPSTPFVCPKKNISKNECPTLNLIPNQLINELPSPFVCPEKNNSKNEPLSAVHRPPSHTSSLAPLPSFVPR